MNAIPDLPGRRGLRVLTFLHSFEPGGVERVALRLHSAWSAMGVDSRLVMGRTNGAMAREWPGLSCEVLDRTGLTGPVETLWMIARLPAVIRRLRPDALFCAGNSYTIVAVAMRLLLGRACPPIVAKISNDLHRRDMPAPARPFYRLWLRIQGRWIDRLVGMAPPMRDEIAALMRVPAGRVAIIDDPSLDMADIARLSRVRAATPPGDPRRFLAIGRLAPQKNFALLIDAFARIARKYDRLVILGEGPERTALVQRARRLGMADRIEMPGHVHPLDTELARATALVMSSDYEGVPAVVPEALAAGLPVVATDCSTSMGDLLGQGRFGLLVPVGDADALASGMDAIAAHPFDVAEAREQAMRFTVEIAAGDYVREMIAANHHSAAREFTPFPVASH